MRYRMLCRPRWQRKVGAPEIAEHAAQVRGRVVPAVLGRTGGVSATAHGDQNDWLSLQAAPGHVEAVRQYVFDALRPDQVAELHDTGRQIVGKVDPQHVQLPTGQDTTE